MLQIISKGEFWEHRLKLHRCLGLYFRWKIWEFRLVISRNTGMCSEYNRFLLWKCLGDLVFFPGLSGNICTSQKYLQRSCCRAEALGEKFLWSFWNGNPRHRVWPARTLGVSSFSKGRISERLFKWGGEQQVIICKGLLLTMISTPWKFPAKDRDAYGLVSRWTSN